MSERTRKDATSPSPAAEAHGGQGKPTSGNVPLPSAMWEHVREGAMHFPGPGTLPPRHPVRQFIQGLSLPFHLARALRSDAQAWRRYLRVAILQSLVIIGVGLAFTGSANEAVDVAQQRAQKDARAEAAEASAREERKRHKQEVKLAAEEIARKLRELHASLEAVEIGAEPKSGPGPVPIKPPTIEHPAIESPSPEHPPVPAAVVPPPAPPDIALEHALTEALDEKDSSEAEGKSPRAVKKLEVVIEGFQFWAALFAAMQIIQWVVIAFSRDYHDAISRDVSLVTRIEPEDEELTPRIRLDLKWLGKKVSRYVRALIVVMAGLPVIYLATAPWSSSAALRTVLVPLWSGYWFVVFTTSKTGQAWKDTTERPPWFLRGWNWLTTRVPGFRWGFLQAYGRFWTNRTRSVFSPAVELEKQPWAFTGLTVIRALAILPVLKCFLRPLIPVAAAHLVLAQRSNEPAVPTQQPTLPSPPTTGASASAA